MNDGNTLETAQLWLRPYCAEDLDLMVPLYGDPAVAAYTKLGNCDRDRTRAILEGYLETWRTRGFGMRALFLGPAGDFIGECGLFMRKSGAPALRYALLPAHWGQGFAVEAVQATLHDAFAVHGLEQVVSIVQVPNRGSHRVMAKAGLRVAHNDRDGDTELIVYEATRNEWLVKAGG